MEERKDAVKLGGKPVTLLGPDLKPGDDAPDVELMDNDLHPFRLSNYKGKTVILTTVLSLDTSVCDAEVRKFNEKASSLDNVEVVTVSMDLPFTQKRWCGQSDLDNVKTYSDYRSGELGKKYGTLIKDLNLHARSVFVIDKNGDIQYKQFVPEVSQEPDYDEAIEAVKKITG